MSIRKIHQKLWLRSALTLLAVALCLSAYADGEQRFHEEGTKWVDPVEFYELQDIDRTDFQRDYDQGDIDFNRVLKEKGVKVYGLRLKPIAGAMRVRKFMNIGYDDYQSSTIDYQTLYGIEGVPLHEAGFCVYVDESVSRTYSISYSYSVTDLYDEGRTYTDKGKCDATISIAGLRLVPSSEGVGFSYSLQCKGVERETTSGAMDGVDRNTDTMTKEAGVDGRLGKFIYFSESRDLLVMLSATAKSVADKASSEDLTAEEKQKMSTRPWPRVYFIVEQILVEDTVSGIPVPALSVEDSQELTSTLENLMLWLKGEGDPLGLGEHSGPKEAAAINAISIIASIFLSSGIAGMVSGSGAQVVAGLTSSIMGAGSGTPPPPTPSSPPDMPNMDGLKPKRPEEEEKPEDTPPPPPDPNKFVPTKYPELCKKYHLTQQPDGDIVMESPSTKKELHYYSYGDGTYFTDFTRDQDDPNQRYTREEIEERLRLEAENKGYFKHIADKAEDARREQPDIQRKVDKEFYDEYRKWKEQCQKDEHHQDVLNKVALRRGVLDSSDEKAIRRNITAERVGIETWQAKQDLKDAALVDAVASVGLVPFDAVDKTCETAIFALAGANPQNLAAKGVQDAYIVMRSTGQAGVEALYMKKGRLAHIGLGTLKGVNAMMFQSHAKDFSKILGTGLPGEAAMFIGSDGINSTISAMEQGKDAGKAALGAMKVKTIAYGLGKVPIVGSGLSKGLINGYYFTTDTLPEAWGALKRFKAAYSD